MAARRRGFTLVELLVVMSIIAALMGLLLPAVQSAREAARRSTCLSNTNQFGLAAQQFEGSRRTYPGYYNLIGNKYVSYMVALLPYMERNDLYKIWSDNSLSTTSSLVASASVYMAIGDCPSNPLGGQGGTPLSYVANSGIGDSLSSFSSLNLTAQQLVNLQAASGIFQNRDPTIAATSAVRVNSDYVSANDGLSMTLLFSENTLTASNWIIPSTYDYTTAQKLNTFVWWHTLPTAPTGLSASPGNSINAYRASASVPTGVPTDLQWSRPSSNHPGGVNAVFCDAHTRFLTEDIAAKVYKQLLSPNGAMVYQLIGDQDQGGPTGVLLDDSTY